MAWLATRSVAWPAMRRLLEWYQTWLTPAGFDWDLWNRTAAFDRAPPPASAPLADRVRWVLALGPAAGGEIAAFSMGATYSEESEGASYIPGMMGHAVATSASVDNQPFSFGDCEHLDTHTKKNKKQKKHSALNPCLSSPPELTVCWCFFLERQTSCSIIRRSSPLRLAVSPARSTFPDMRSPSASSQTCRRRRGGAAAPRSTRPNCSPA